LEGAKVSLKKTSRKTPPRASESSVSALRGLESENKRLKRRVKELEKTVGTAQAECTRYRKLAQSWMRAQFTSEELRRFTLDDDETDCQPLEQFVGELEAIVRRKRKKGA
jgi:hypothetical protein